MDRRQRKTREAILGAFTELLSKKKYEKITVGEIIERADVGRATFYAHFETKDFLLKALCEELFCHIFDAASGDGVSHRHIFECDSHAPMFLHLLSHLESNDNNILRLLSSENTGIFVKYFKENLKELVEKSLVSLEGEEDRLSRSFLVNHLASSFVEAVRWWIDGGMTESAERVYQRLASVTKPFLR